MGRSREDSRKLRSRCTICGTEYEESSLEKLKKRIVDCCKSPTRRKYTLPNIQKTGLSLPAERPASLPFSIEFDRSIESQNTSHYAHWSRGRKDKKDWMRRVAIKLAKMRGLMLPWSSWAIRRIYCSPKREMDFANVVGGAKPLIDSLRDCSIIEDDSPKYFECEYRQEKGDRNVTILTLVKADYGDSD